MVYHNSIHQIPIQKAANPRQLWVALRSGVKRLEYMEAGFRIGRQNGPAPQHLRW